MLYSTASSSPYCAEWQFGGITAWVCSDSFQVSRTIDSTYDEEREFETIVFVDGTPRRTVSSPILTSTPETTIPDTEDTTIETTTPEEPSTSEPSASETETTPPPPPPPGPNVGAIVGGVVGGLAVICLTILGVLYILRRNRRRDQSHGSLSEPTAHSGVPDTQDVGSPTITQPYSSRTISPAQPQNDAMHPQTAYFNHDALEATTSDHMNSSSHEFGGLGRDRQYASTPGT